MKEVPILSFETIYYWFYIYCIFSIQWFLFHVRFVPNNLKHPCLINPRHSFIPQYYVVYPRCYFRVILECKTCIKARSIFLIVLIFAKENEPHLPEPHSRTLRKLIRRLALDCPFLKNWSWTWDSLLFVTKDSRKNT